MGDDSCVIYQVAMAVCSTIWKIQPERIFVTMRGSSPYDQLAYLFDQGKARIRAMVSLQGNLITGKMYGVNKRSTSECSITRSAFCGGWREPSCDAYACSSSSGVSFLNYPLE